jgi:hypothetical protein
VDNNEAMVLGLYADIIRIFEFGEGAQRFELGEPADLLEDAKLHRSLILSRLRLRQPFRQYVQKKQGSVCVLGNCFAQDFFSS